jgi:hypothetical protein
MAPRRSARVLLRSALAVAAAAGALTACSSSGGGTSDRAASPAAAAPASIRSAAPPAAQLAPPAHAGEVRIEQGPFTDRLALTELRLADGVTGHVKIGSDVSDTLALEIRAAFYDADGKLLGSASFAYQEEEETGPAHGDADNAHKPRAAGEGVDFAVAVPPGVAKPSAAVLSVPVLVNE